MIWVAKTQTIAAKQKRGKKALSVSENHRFHRRLGFRCGFDRVRQVCSEWFRHDSVGAGGRAGRTCATLLSPCVCVCVRLCRNSEQSQLCQSQDSLPCTSYQVLHFTPMKMELNGTKYVNFWSKRHRDLQGKFRKYRSWPLHPTGNRTWVIRGYLFVFYAKLMKVWACQLEK